MIFELMIERARWKANWSNFSWQKEQPKQTHKTLHIEYLTCRKLIILRRYIATNLTLYLRNDKSSDDDDWKKDELFHVIIILNFNL